MNHYFVRIGTLGEIRMANALVSIDRGRRVVVRSPRGVEVAEVISRHHREKDWDGDDAVRYRIIRPTTQADEQLVERLERYKCEAVESCRNRLSRSSSKTMLLDVDQLLDGGTLVMHFLGEVDSIAKKITREIAETYESVVRTNHLSELLTEGCGPECGTTAGCGTATACAGCSGCGH